jgi:membrane fusion protein, multidrug efflux system
VVQRDVPVYSEWVGTTEGFVNAQIYPKVARYLLKQNYQDGQEVKTGQLLFQVDPREYQAALDQALGELAQKKAEDKKNQQDLARYKPLYAQQVVSKQDFDHVNQAARASAAAVQAAEAAVESARLNLQWTQVTSPIEGISGIAKAQVGELVSPSTPRGTESRTSNR